MKLPSSQIQNQSDKPTIHRFPEKSVIDQFASIINEEQVRTCSEAVQDVDSVSSDESDIFPNLTPGNRETNLNSNIQMNTQDRDNNPNMNLLPSNDLLEHIGHNTS